MTYETLVVDDGTVSTPVVAGGNSLTDARKAWQNGVHRNRAVRIQSGQGIGQVAFVQDNSRDSLIIRGGWLKPLAAGDTYAIIDADFMQLPVPRAAVFNQALPTAEANWLGEDITPTSSPSYLRVYITVAAAGILRVARTIGGVPVVENLNHGVPLAASSAYLFTGIEWRYGDSLNFRYSATGANILVFRADEIGGAD